MEKIIPIMVIITVDKFIQGKPISSGFTLKLNPIYVQEDFGSDTEPQLELYAQDSSKQISSNERFLHKVAFPRYENYGVGSTNQIARILFPSNPAKSNNVQQDGFIKIPVIPQPFTDYKIIVATAPWNVKISGREAEPVVVYVVFPSDGDDHTPHVNVVPSIYFVKKKSELLDLSKRDQFDPIIVIDSNRTVTGLKSKKVAKYISFKNKLIHRDNYEVSR